MKILVVVPTYNEADNIERVITRLHTTMPEAHALIVDDASPDGTGKIAEAMADADERVQVVHRPGKAGLGAAYVAGFAWGLERGYDVLVEMDADGSHAPEQLPRLIAALPSADVVIGSRWVRGGAVVNWPLRRELLSRGANVYSRLALGIGVHDATGGYRAYRREMLEQIDYSSTSSQGYCFQVELVLRAVRGGFRVAEVPITFADRERGESKMSGTIVREALWKVTRWGVEHRAGQLRDALK